MRNTVRRHIYKNRVQKDNTKRYNTGKATFQHRPVVKSKHMNDFFKALKQKSFGRYNIVTGSPSTDHFY